jgi:hypothetical protein
MYVVVAVVVVAVVVVVVVVVAVVCLLQQLNGSVKRPRSAVQDYTPKHISMSMVYTKNNFLIYTII